MVDDSLAPSKRSGANVPDMERTGFPKLLEDALESACDGKSLCVLGATDWAQRLLTALREAGFQDSVRGVFGTHPPEATLDVALQPLIALQDMEAEVLVVAEDAYKEQLLRDALPYIKGTPKIIVAGYDHLEYRDPTFLEEQLRLGVPSLANGYPNSLIHAFECLKNAARLKLAGSVAEFGVFRGGTTMFMSRVIERLGAQWHIIGFDTFSGFPPRRSPLDMYDHPDCEKTSTSEVCAYLRTRDVEIVEGDIVETCSRVEKEDLVFSFFDTDNYSPTRAALTIVRERTVVGGSILFDHYTGIDRFRYTLGERMAAEELLANDDRYFNLHGTGVFLRQR